MEHSRLPSRRLVIFVGLIVLGLAACSSAPYRYKPIDESGVIQRALQQEQGAFRLRASVPSKEEAKQIFGIPTYDRGIQPVWLEVTNHADSRARLVISSIDREYFSPLEVAYMFKKQFSKEGWMDMERYLYQNALPRQIPPHQTVSGFVFTHVNTGTKAFNVDIYHTGRERQYEQFTFFVEVPGFVPDHAEIDFKSLYAESEVRHTDVEGLRALLAEVPCCTTDRTGSGQGRPVQVFFVAAARDLLRALLRAGWNESSYARDEAYLEKADYLYGRPADAIFRKGRDRSTERAELGIWLAPVLVNQQPMWVAQFKHAIGRRYAIGELLLGVQLDPDSNDGRNYVLQNMWYTQSLKHWAWSATGLRVSDDSPVSDFNGYPWFARDPYRVVLWISGSPVALVEATQFEWDRVVKRAEDLP